MKLINTLLALSCSVSLFAQGNTQGSPCSSVGFHIADIIDIQHTDTLEPESRAGKQPLSTERVRTDIDGTDNSDYAEKDKHEKITQPPVSVGILP